MKWTRSISPKARKTGQCFVEIQNDANYSFKTFMLTHMNITCVIPCSTVLSYTARKPNCHAMIVYYFGFNSFMRFQDIVVGTLWLPQCYFAHVVRWCLHAFAKMKTCNIWFVYSMYRVSPTVWPLCAFFFVLLQFYVPFYVKNKKIDNFMCLLEFAKRLKAHSWAIPVSINCAKSTFNKWCLHAFAKMKPCNIWFVYKLRKEYIQPIRGQEIMGIE